MEAGIGASAISKWQMLILQEVLNVAELMVHSKELALGNRRALLDAYIVLQIEVPGTGMANQIPSICGLLNNRFVPEVSASEYKLL